MLERLTNYLQKQSKLQSNTVKQTVDENSTVQLFQPTIDYHLDSLGNSEVPSCDEERLVEYYHTTHSNDKDEIGKKRSDNNSSSHKKN